MAREPTNPTEARKWASYDKNRMVVMAGAWIGIISSLLVLGYFVRDVHYLGETIIRIEGNQSKDRESLERIAGIVRDNQREIDRRGSRILTNERAIEGCCPRYRK